MASVTSAYFAYRAGKTQALDDWQERMEDRLREVELGMTEFQVLIRNRRRQRFLKGQQRDDIAE